MHSTVHVSKHLLALFGKSLLETYIKLQRFTLGSRSFVYNDNSALVNRRDTLLIPYESSIVESAIQIKNWLLP